MVFKKLFLTTSLCLTMFGLAAAPMADRKHTDEQGNYGVLTEDACRLPELVAADPATKINRAYLMINGVHYEACYVEMNDMVFIIDQDGDSFGPFPAEMFKPVVNT